VLYSDLPAGTQKPGTAAISSFLILAALIAAACYFGWSALGALRSGEVSLYVRANRDRRFSRGANPAGYWIVVCWYLVLAMVCASGIVLRSWWQ
jgi:hypothetical protein